MRIPLGVGNLDGASWEVELHIAGRMTVFEKGVVGCGQRGGGQDGEGDERSKRVYFSLSETFGEVTNGGQPEIYARDLRRERGRKTREYELEEAVDSIMDGSDRRTFD